ncbi:MAG: hypothetical protein H0T66_13400 [Geodermatophilaceae bacterium]|nr:hypothetical protein [Geodermatophilaceae bacterium]MDQ3455590.1 hypothetical protein [Actinomycetota bacterium]
MITAVGTGLDSFTNPESITVLSPFAGWEGLFVALGVLLWIGWHVRQVRAENKDYDEALELYEQVGVERAMQFGGTTHLLADEDIEVVRAEMAEGNAGPRPAETALDSDGSHRTAGA